MIRDTLFSGWNFMRWLRLFMGGLIAVEALQMHDYLSGSIGAFFILQALTNTGCCGTNGCSTPVQYTKKHSATEEVEFEEIKNK